MSMGDAHDKHNYTGLKARGERGEDALADSSSMFVVARRNKIVLIVPHEDGSGSCWAYPMSAAQARTFADVLNEHADALDKQMPPDLSGGDFRL